MKPKGYSKLMRFMIIHVFISVVAPAKPVNAGQEGKLEFAWFGYSQITEEAGDGVAKKADKSDNGLRTGADRVRLGFKARYGSVFSKLQVDFNRKDISKRTAGIPEIIKDAEVGYRFSNVASFKVGIFKTPVGMDFNTSGAKLDITKRGMEKALVLERTLGMMLSGRNIGPGLGYDIGFFNPATRSMAVNGGFAGKQYAYAVRLYYDTGKTLRAETSYGLNREAGGIGTEDYGVWDAALSYKINGVTLKSEYINSRNIGGFDGKDQQVWYLHAGYLVTPMFESVIRHYQGKDDLNDTNLNNTFIGLNVFLNPLKKHTTRIQLNYVIARGDKESWRGIGGYKNGAFLAQFQFAF